MAGSIISFPVILLFGVSLGGVFPLFFSILISFGLVEGLGLLTPIASTLVSFIFLSLETVGQEIENPFENTVHDTPLSSLSRTIEINLLQDLGAKRLPHDVRPVEGFLY